MNIREYEDKILNTDVDDWIKTGCWGAFSGPSYLNSFKYFNSGSGEFELDSHAEIITLKEDLLISVAWGLSHNEDYKMAWTKVFTDPTASSSFIDFFYSGQLVFRDIYISVDGARCSIPSPRSIINNTTHQPEKYVVPENKYQFICLINQFESVSISEYKQYFEQTNFERVNETWMK